ncbi:hypothetical protein Dtox_3920 [Desulfofarcimen acetoxidans DSM 771]|uniref:ASCH domain-containing protein n=1 Tax=Desulfofarcimen acetoxidans (strain ATCC 49208 / DSM 771 / KCTC 5769 / VKM B-1644 / 5575) TaxID=485916 RepID=C8VXY4_DESAS|nr:ASCH domain-containing protein [Desulfofarcimen acetoxidans]ACV64613.1 hypothetical protein Dtox_3920 [Desulfofarcimen acetoxidans DSM 771]
MKAISIRQPWATLVVHGLKTIELRNWKRKYNILPQSLYIHTGSRVDKTAPVEVWQLAEQFETSKVRGAIIGMVNLIEMFLYDNAEKFDLDRGLHLTNWEYTENLYGLRMKDAMLIDKPVNYRGQLGLFNVDGKITQY